MKLRYSLIAATQISALLFGCSTRHAVNQGSERAVVPVQRELVPLKQEAGWPVVEAAVRSAVARNEGTNSPLASGHYNPLAHQQGTWAVVVSLAFPDYRQAEHICLLVSEGGQIATYGRVPGRTKK